MEILMTAPILVVMVAGFMLLMFVLAGMIVKFERLRMQKYGADERYVVYHMGGLSESEGLPRLHRLELFLAAETLTIKPWRRPAIHIPMHDITIWSSFWTVKRPKNKVYNAEQAKAVFGEVEPGPELEPIREWMGFRRTQDYLLLNYMQGDRIRTVGFGFRYTATENWEDRPFYRCIESLNAYVRVSRTRNPKDAVEYVSLQKKIESQNGQLVWRKDPQTGRMTSEWEE